MPAPPTFVVARFPGEGTALGLATKAHPGSVVDLFLEPSGGGYSAVGLARGVGRPALDELFRDLAQRYGVEAEPIRTTPDGSTAFRWDLGAEVHSAPMRSLARFQADFQAPWARVEAGRLTIRSEAPGEAGEHAERIRAALADAGLGADLDTQGLDDADRAVLDQLRALRGADGGKPSSWSKIAGSAN